MTPNSVLIRVTPAQRAWLEYTATANNRTQAAQVRHLIEAAMKDEPLQIVVHDCKYKGQDRYFAVSVGHFGREFFETPDKEQAVWRARDKAKELGLDRDAITFNSETDEENTI